MKTPEFWRQGKGGAKASALAPLACLYSFGAALRRRFTRPARVEVPVICVGNVTAGGTGKTPIVMAIAATAHAMGIEAAVVSRGYGGALQGPVKVDPARHGVADVGDEPLLIAAQAPIWVAKDRVAGVRSAISNGAALVILDDGFQNPCLHKDYSLIVVDGGFGFGNEHVLPAGPLREPLGKAMERADLVVLMGRDDAGVRDKIPPTVLSENASLRPKPPESLPPGTKCIAFAGIGLPEKFFSSLRAIGLDVLAEYPFPDHFMYAPADLDALVKEAASKQAVLVTTAKDHVRLPSDMAGAVQVLEVTVEFESKDLPNALIARVMGNG